MATDGPKFPTARRTAPAEEMKRSIGVVETIDLPAGWSSEDVVVQCVVMESQ